MGDKTMKRRSYSFSIAALWLFAVVIAIAGVSCRGTSTNTNNANGPSPTPDPCTSITDKDIVENIYSELAKVTELRTQLGTIDVVANNRAVTLWGWVLTEPQRTQVMDIAQKSPCVTSVNGDNFYYEANLGEKNPLRPIPGGGCAPNYIRCGDICIPSGTGCGLEKNQTSSALTNTANSNAVSNKNSNANTNSNTATKSNTAPKSNTGY
jgi:hypothetical protein